MKKRGRRWAWVMCGLLLWCGLAGVTPGAVPFLQELSPAEETPPSEPPPTIDQAFEAAIAAANMAQSARTPDEWSAVAAQWGTAIQSLQSLPPESPQRVFAQRKAREYLNNQAIAQRRAEAAAAPVVFPTFGSPVLDEQLGVYLSYVATFGPPDVMVVGSSRALQGINPQILQQRLSSEQGLESVRVYTFAVNGATAQVMSFVLRRLLTPEQLPHILVWAGGSRAFNSGRVDRTFASILDSPGYAALEAGDRPAIDWEQTEDRPDNTKAAPIPITAINGYGFLPVEAVFDPVAYYQQFPRVAGLYDAAYQGFQLDGLQTVSFRAIAAFTQAQDISLVFINLPLSSDYLDETRLQYERQFQQYLRREAALGDFTVVDLLQQWPTQNQFFADPSHLNQIGAAQISILLASDRTLPWQRLAPDEAAPSDETPPAVSDPEANPADGE